MMFMVKKNRRSFIGIIFVLFCATVPAAHAKERSLLAQDVFEALQEFAQLQNENKSPNVSPSVHFWVEQFEKRGVSKTFVENRLRKLHQKITSNKSHKHTTLWQQQFLQDFVELKDQPSIRMPHTRQTLKRQKNLAGMSVQAAKLEVIDEYDDLMNDDIYMHFVISYQDMVWGKVTGLYRNLNQGDLVIFAPEDRHLFGPDEKFISPESDITIDFGITESDNEDIAELQQLSDTIVALVYEALRTYYPQTSSLLDRIRDETQNLLRMLISMNEDDRLVTDSITLKISDLALMSREPMHHITRAYEEQTFWTRFNYRTQFRVLTSQP
jgi:hypothetical protein